METTNEGPTRIIIGLEYDTFCDIQNYSFVLKKIENSIFCKIQTKRFSLNSTNTVIKLFEKCLVAFTE